MKRMNALILSLIFFILSIFSSSLIFVSFSSSYDKSQYTEVHGTVSNIKLIDDESEGGWYIVLNEYNSYYRIIPISEDIVTIQEIKDKLQSRIEVFLTITNYKRYTNIFNVMGIKTNSNIILEVDDMIARLQQNDLGARIAGIILVSLLLTASLISLVFGIINLKKREYSNFGRLMMKKNYYGNQIEVYNDTSTLILIINDETADKFVGIIALKAILTGKIITDDGEKTIRLKLSIWGTLTLYCEEVRIGRKYAPFG